MNTDQIKTVAVVAYEWPDRVHGGDWFAAYVTLNYQRPDETTLTVPFQKGSGDRFKDAALGVIKNELGCLQGIERPWELKGLGIEAKFIKYDRCRYRDIKDIGN